MTRAEEFSYKHNEIAGKDLEKIYDLALRLRGELTEINKEDPKKLKSILRGFKKYTGCNQDFGEGLFYNTYGSGLQLLFALAMSRDPLIEKVVNDVKFKDLRNFDAAVFIKRQILRGMKILDIGCGRLPSFARVARQMGADVYTVDRISADDFFEGLDMPPEQKEQERIKHIKLDIDDQRAVQKILEATNGNFDLATEASLEDDRGWNNDEVQGKDIGSKLLKKGGIYLKDFKPAFCNSREIN